MQWGICPDCRMLPKKKETDFLEAQFSIGTSDVHRKNKIHLDDEG